MTVWVIGVIHDGDIFHAMSMIRSIKMEKPTVFIEARPQDLGGFFPFEWWRDLTLELVKNATVIPLESRKRGEVKFNLPGEILQPTVPERISAVKKHPQEIARETYWAERISEHKGDSIVIVGERHSDNLTKILRDHKQDVILDNGRDMQRKTKSYSHRFGKGGKIYEYDIELVPETLSARDLVKIQRYLRKFRGDKTKIRITQQNAKKYTRRFLPRIKHY